MRHQEFAEQAARKLEDIAEATNKDEPPIGNGITSMRANELRVAARVVRDLSEVTTQGERRFLEERLPLDVPS